MEFLYISKPLAPRRASMTPKDWKEKVKKYPNWQNSYEEAFKSFESTRSLDIEAEEREQVFRQKTFKRVPTCYAQKLELQDIYDSKGYGKADFVSATVLQANSSLVKTICERLRDFPLQDKLLINDIQMLELAADAKNLYIKLF